MSNNLLIGDLFCGAGGTSTGVVRAVRELGREVTLICVNHWPVAIETHKRNHPEARHYLQDINTADPVKIVPEGYLDLLCASPECTGFSRARGGKPTNDQQRMPPFRILDWLTKLDVCCLLIENVSEFISWGPLLEDGRPDPTKKGMYFQSWFNSIRDLGYKPEWRYLNAADFGDATTRTRFFLIARKDGKPVRWPHPTHTKTGDKDMFEHLPEWRAAREIINWDNPGRSLLDDPRYLKKPLSEKTLKRIARGLEKFGGALAPLYINLLGLTTGQNVTDCHSPESFVMGKQSKPCYRGLDEPVPTITTKAYPQLIEPIIEPIIEPFVMGKQGHSPAYRPVDKPTPTITADGRPVLIEPIAKPFILGQQSCSAARDSGYPIPTITSDGAISLVEPTLVKYYSTGICHSTDEPLPAVTTKDRFGLVTPEAFIVQNRIRPDGDRVYDIEKPVLTVTGHGAGSLVNPVIFNWEHSKSLSPNARSVDKPLYTQTKKQHTGLVEPILKVPENDNVDPRRLVYINGELYYLDLRFRMLENLELARAMGFTDSESTYEFCGNKSEVTKQIGNAVPVNLAKALVKSILES